MDKLYLNRLFYKSEDHDEFGAMLRVAYVEEKLLEPGSFEASANIVLSSNIIVGNFKINKKVFQIGTGAPGYITFPIWDPSVFFSYRKYDMNKGMIGVLWNNEHQSVSGAGFNGLPISIRESYFNEICQIKGYPDLLDKLRKCEVLHVPETQLAEIRQLVRFVTQNSGLNDQVVCHLLEDKIINLLIPCIASAFPEKENPDLTYPKFARVVDYIHENLSIITSVRQICENAQIPERTLRRLINKKYDISPKTYLNKLRLNEVRKKLKSNSGNSEIIQVASEFNFWHMGQFASDYKMLFGELPSETLKSSLSKQGFTNGCQARF